jgi:mannose-6-phosphate isomerase-like protein (cupin superfamily)
VKVTARENSHFSIPSLSKSEQTMIDQENAAAAMQTFRLRTALLKAGRTTRFIASTEGDGHAMSVAIKCYAEGGENEFHAHAHEDHMFVVLQGRAVFYEPAQPDRELGRNEGILIPAGTFYKFEAVPGEPLVLLRVGNTYVQVEGSAEAARAEDRLGLNGAALPSQSSENKHVTGVPIEGVFFE